MSQTPVATAVAIVEDDPLFRATLTRILARNKDFRYVGAWSSGEEALAGMEALRPDVVLMDINLATMSGIECTARLKQRQPSPQVLMLTVYEDTDQIFSALKAGASGYLLKRSSPDEIAEAIRDVLEGGAPMTSQIARKVVQSFRASQPAPGSEVLTPREEDILRQASQGYITKEIADRLNISLSYSAHAPQAYLRKTARPLPDGSSYQVPQVSFSEISPG